MSGKTKVTTRDIARECGLSQSTVSMVLSGRMDMRFTPETIEKVMNTAKRMGYSYKRKTLKKENKSAKTILIMCPSLSSEYYSILIKSITESAARKGLYTLVSHTMRTLDREEYYLNLAADSGFFGVIYTYAPKAVDLINQLSKKQAYVLINDYNPDLKIGLVELDSRKSGQLIAGHLISEGHRHIAYITTPLEDRELPRINRLKGLRDGCLKAGLSADAIEVVALTQEQWNHYLLGNRYYDAGRQLVTAYLKQGGKATAFVGTNDPIAIGIIDALKQMGYSIPKDYSVCGFDNTLSSSFRGISLTTIDHCIDEKGKDAVDMLISSRQWIMKEKDGKQPPVMRLEYEPQLLVRDSTGKCRI